MTDDEICHIKKKDFEPIIHPLISIKIHSVSTIFNQSDKAAPPDALLFTSQNAVDAFDACRKINPDWLSLLPVFAVGRKTQQRLIDSGISATIADEQTGSGIAQKLISLFDRNSVIWHFCGNMKRPETGEIIQRGHLSYIPIECYETVELSDAGFPKEPFRAVVFYSPSAVRAFARFEDCQWLQSVIVGIGETTAKELNSLGFNDVAVPREPSTENVLDLLGELFNEKQSTLT